MQSLALKILNYTTGDLVLLDSDRDGLAALVYLRTSHIHEAPNNYQKHWS
jgi:hypothetical protein